MSLAFLFLVLLLLSFAVLFYLLKPTAIEKAVARQLEDIEQKPGLSNDRGTILKEEAIRSSTVLDDLAVVIPWTPAVVRLIKQSGREWRPSSTVAFSLLAGFG